MLKRWLDLMQSASASALITKVRAALVVLPSLSVPYAESYSFSTLHWVCRKDPGHCVYM